MGTKWRRLAALGAILLPTLVVTACLNAEPKLLGQQNPLDFGAFNGSGLGGAFTFNFALLQTTPAGTIGVQGTTNSSSSITGTCNLNGTSCQCNFYKADQVTKLTPSTTTAQISYDQPGNYLTCTIPAGITATDIGYVTVSNLDGSVTSAKLPVVTPAQLTLSQLIGSDLDANRVRSVSRYACEYHYLQKDSTSSAGFSCLHGSNTCNTTSGVSSTFCIVAARIPFYLYADTFTNNSTAKIADRLYGGAGGTNTLCGLQIKQINCVASDVDSDAFGTPVKEFGLYNEATGIWQSAISLPSGPDQSSANVGFGAATSLVPATLGNCPPGLQKKVFYTATLTAAGIGAAPIPPTNAPGTQTLTEVADPAAPPLAFAYNKFIGGSCNDTTCTLPAGQLKPTPDIPTVPYTSTGFTPFCVIPSTLLP